LNSVDDIQNEIQAIQAIEAGNWVEATNLLGGDKARLTEVQMLFDAKYTYTIDWTTNSIHWTKP